MGQKLRSPLSQGFTVTEAITVMMAVTILSAIVAPAWLGFIGRQQLRNATNKVYWVMQNARTQARAERISYQATFRREEKDRLLYAIHRADRMPIDISDGEWQTLPDGVQVDKNNTTLLPVNPATNRRRYHTGYYRVTFNYQGCPVNKLTDECTQTGRIKGKVVLKHQFLGERRRCVIVSTLIGALRTAEEISEAKSNGKHCYKP